MMAPTASERRAMRHRVRGGWVGPGLGEMRELPCRARGHSSACPAHTPGQRRRKARAALRPHNVTGKRARKPHAARAECAAAGILREPPSAACHPGTHAEGRISACALCGCVAVALGGMRWRRAAVQDARSPRCRGAAGADLARGPGRSGLAACARRVRAALRGLSRLLRRALSAEAGVVRRRDAGCEPGCGLNVIQERFWVTFFDPAAPAATRVSERLTQLQTRFELPAHAGSNALPFT